MRCRSCGVEGEGNFCTRCGEPLAAEGEGRCGGCGSELRAGDVYCGECGRPTGGRRSKPLGSKLPWILSAVVLVLFSVGIALFVQRWSAPRPPGGVMTGGIPVPERDETGGVEERMPSGEDRSAAMPSADELAAMSPREAADRLFDRAMRERDGEEPERAAFFARMGLQAYARVPAAEMDDDAWFHVGLLHLAAGDLEGARGTVGLLLESDPRHLLGLALGARVAEAAGDAEGAEAYRRRLRRAIEDGVSPEEPPYAPHAALIEREASRVP